MVYVAFAPMLMLYHANSTTFNYKTLQKITYLLWNVLFPTIVSQVVSQVMAFTKISGAVSSPV